jgi:SAM-dependent methyltransferase
MSGELHAGTVAEPGGQAQFVSVTEISGTPISAEQLERLVNRYVWAAGFCGGKDVVEVACGVGPGLGLLEQTAKSLEAGDYSAPILEIARRHYGKRVALQQFDAARMPFADASKDVIILFEAIYYLPRPENFVTECVRVLRRGGQLLVASANKDLWDFHPSPYSHQYFGVADLAGLLGRHGFSCQFLGYQPVDRSPLRQRVLRPLKRLAVVSGLMPRTMGGKRWLKRIVFGAEVPMPGEITRTMATYVPPVEIVSTEPDRRHKIIYCVATKRDERC